MNTFAAVSMIGEQAAAVVLAFRKGSVVGGRPPMTRSRQATTLSSPSLSLSVDFCVHNSHAPPRAPCFALARPREPPFGSVPPPADGLPCVRRGGVRKRRRWREEDGGSNGPSPRRRERGRRWRRRRPSQPPPATPGVRPRWRRGRSRPVVVFRRPAGV